VRFGGRRTIAALSIRELRRGFIARSGKLPREVELSRFEARLEGLGNDLLASALSSWRRHAGAPPAGQTDP